MSKLRADYLTRFKPAGEASLADKPIPVILPKDLDTYIRGLPNRSEWLRDAIAQKRANEMRGASTSPRRSAPSR